jgi:hypothetical protein
MNNSLKNKNNGKINKDIKTWGDSDLFKLINKSFSEEELLLKSIRAMEIKDVGCIIESTAEKGYYTGPLSEIKWERTVSTVFVPEVRIKENKNKIGEVISRNLVKLKI